jgi:hypothetical protein
MKKMISHWLWKGFLSCLLYTVFCLLPTVVKAQISFEKTYGSSYDEVGYSVEQTSDGGYIVAGYTDPSGLGLTDIYLIKTDSLGDTLWTRTYDESNYDRAQSVIETSDGGYILAGSKSGVGLQNVYVIKTDSFGNTLWVRDYGGSSGDGAESVRETRDGGYIIAGFTLSYGAGSSDIYLIRMDSTGDTLWTKTYGGSNQEGGTSVQETVDGGFIIAGATNSFGAGNLDLYLVRTDSLGVTLWSKTYGGVWNDYGSSIQETQDGGYVIVGTTVSFGIGNGDVYVVRTDSQGDSLWTKTYGGLGVDGGRSIQQTSDGGYILTGSTEFWGAIDLYLVKTDSFGDTLWTRTFGDTARENGFSVQQTSDGGFIIAGYTESFGAGGDDVYLIKTAGDGTVGIEEELKKNKVNYSKIILFQNQPNPFQRWTVIGYSLPETGSVTLKIYDINGRLVETLVNEPKEPGLYDVRWEGINRANGIYYYRLSINNLTATKKMILLK